MITTIRGVETPSIPRADQDIQYKCTAFSHVEKPRTPARLQKLQTRSLHRTGTSRSILQGITWGIATWVCLALREDTLRNFSAVSECGRKLSLAQDTDMNVIIIKL